MVVFHTMWFQLLDDICETGCTITCFVGFQKLFSILTLNNVSRNSVVSPSITLNSI